ncbi:hypothetical protein SK128_019712, partial [Halocaridina rubra]
MITRKVLKELIRHVKKELLKELQGGREGGGEEDEEEEEEEEKKKRIISTVSIEGTIMTSSDR